MPEDSLILLDLDQLKKFYLKKNQFDPSDEIINNILNVINS